MQVFFVLHDFSGARSYAEELCTFLEPKGYIDLYILHLSCKTIYTLHHLDPVFSYLNIPGERFFFKDENSDLKLFHQVDKIITVTEFARQTVVDKIEIRSTKVARIYNGISMPKGDNAGELTTIHRIKDELGFNIKDRIILFVGRVNKV